MVGFLDYAAGGHQLFCIPICANSGIITMRGFVFSTDPIKPEFKRINPAEGMKKIFALRNLVEFIKGLIKVLAIAFYVVGKHALQALMESTFFLVLKPLVFTVLCAFILVGGVDVMMQR